MKNMGMFESSRNPVKKGGLTNEDIKDLESKGWKHGTTEIEVKDVAIGFEASHLPTGFILQNYTVPAGVAYLYNPEDETAIILACGNPTCWRYLVP
jgi:hypothetical protein